MMWKTDHLIVASLIFHHTGSICPPNVLLVSSYSSKVTSRDPTLNLRSHPESNALREENKWWLSDSLGKAHPSGSLAYLILMVSSTLQYLQKCNFFKLPVLLVVAMWALSCTSLDPIQKWKFPTLTRRSLFVLF